MRFAGNEVASYNRLSVLYIVSYVHSVRLVTFILLEVLSPPQGGMDLLLSIRRRILSLFLDQKEGVYTFYVTTTYYH